jgi:hypothetical protein
MNVNGADRLMESTIPLKVFEAPEIFDCERDEACIKEYTTCMHADMKK